MPGRKHFLNDHFWQTNQSFPFCFTFMSFIHFLPKNSVSKNFSEILENELTSLEMKTVNCPFILFTITNPQRWNQATVGWVFFLFLMVLFHSTTPHLNLPSFQLCGAAETHWVFTAGRYVFILPVTELGWQMSADGTLEAHYPGSKLSLNRSTHNLPALLLTWLSGLQHHRELSCTVVRVQLKSRLPREEE